MQRWMASFVITLSCLVVFGVLAIAMKGDPFPGWAGGIVLVLVFSSFVSAKLYIARQKGTPIRGPLPSNIPLEVLAVGNELFVVARVGDQEIDSIPRLYKPPEGFMDKGIEKGDRILVAFGRKEKEISFKILSKGDVVSPPNEVPKPVIRGDN